MVNQIYTLLWYAAILPACIVLFGAGFWCILLRNPPDPFELQRIEAIPGLRGKLGTWRATVATQTRLVIGFSLMIVGYHAAIWTDPLARIAFGVPIDNWYLLAGGLVLAGGGTLLAERIEARAPESD